VVIVTAVRRSWLGRRRKGDRMWQRQARNWCMVDGWKWIGRMFEGGCKGALLPPRRCVVVTVGGVARRGTHGSIGEGVIDEWD